MLDRAGYIKFRICLQGNKKLFIGIKSSEKSAMKAINENDL